MSNCKNGWYVLYTKPKHEKKVAAKLAYNRLKHYLPMLNVVRQWTDRVKLIQAPMFPSYVFIYLDNLNDYFTPLNIDGVLKYVKFGEHLARVPDVIIHNLKLITEYGEGVEVSFNEFRQGTVLTISEGPFAGMSCEVVQYKNKEKILVRLSLLQRNVLMEIPMRELVKVQHDNVLIRPN